MLVSNSAGYKIFCEKTTVGLDYIENKNHLKFYTTFDGSRNPEYKQTQLEMFLTDDELEALRQALK